MRNYTIVLDPDVEEGGYTVTVPALPGVVTEATRWSSARSGPARRSSCTSRG
jgi:hypothetical protein